MMLAREFGLSVGAIHDYIETVRKQREQTVDLAAQEREQSLALIDTASERVMPHIARAKRGESWMRGARCWVKLLVQPRSLWETFRLSGASVSAGWDHSSTFGDATLLRQSEKGECPNSEY
jgi:hypothetical protein